LGQPDSPRLVHRLVALAAAAAGRLVAAPYETPLPEEWRQRAAALLPAGPIYIGLAPGAGNKERGKCWPLEGYIAVARRQIEQGRVPVFLLGPGEVAWAERLKGELPSALFPDLSPGPTLTVALGARLATAVANCSGTGHMLAAGGCPMVSLFGPTDPRKYAPWSRHVVALRAADFGDGGIGAIPVAAVADAVEHIQRFNTDVAEYLLGPQGLRPLQAAKADLGAPLPSRSLLTLDRVPAGEIEATQRRG
jgi:ADP-heptose:LPS heptosyltransferase